MNKQSVYSDFKDGRRGRNDVGIIPTSIESLNSVRGSAAWEAFGN